MCCMCMDVCWIVGVLVAAILPGEYVRLCVSRCGWIVSVCAVMCAHECMGI